VTLTPFLRYWSIVFWRSQKHGVMVKEIAEANKMGKTREIYVSHANRHPAPPFFLLLF
jgi:hypothetical protein